MKEYYVNPTLEVKFNNNTVDIPLSFYIKILAEVMEGDNWRDILDDVTGLMSVIIDWEEFYKGENPVYNVTPTIIDEVLLKLKEKNKILDNTLINLLTKEISKCYEQNLTFDDYLSANYEGNELSVSFFLNVNIKSCEKNINDNVKFIINSDWIQIKLKKEVIIIKEKDLEKFRDDFISQAEWEANVTISDQI